MGYFPFYIDIENKNCIVIGGGKTALRKIKKLALFNPHITVISPYILPEIFTVPDIEIIQRKYRPGDIDNAFMVITASDNRTLNEEIFRQCRNKNIFVNTVDDIEKCGFIFPALIHRNDITIGISTSGKSPLYAKFLRKVIDDMLDDYHMQIFGVMKRFRPYIKEIFSTEKKRREALEAVLDFCLLDDNIPDDNEIKSMLERIGGKNMKIRIGTRKSKLALAQTNIAADFLKKNFPYIDIEIIPINTRGDRILNKPLEEIGGKGVFVSEIEKALLEKRIDIAVHSAKDLPVKLADGLEISGVTERDDYRDALVMKKGKNITDSPSFTIGTGSIRRRHNIHKIFPHVSFSNIRGNIDTRLKKLSDNEYDSIILSMAGLERLGITENDGYIIYPLDYRKSVPAVCQGIIAIESRKGEYISEIIKNISHADTFLCFETERYFLEVLGAGCMSPVGAYSHICGDDIYMIVSDGKKILEKKENISERFNLAKELAESL